VPNNEKILLLVKMLLGVGVIPYFAFIGTLSLSLLEEDFLSWLDEAHPDFTFPHWLIATGWFDSVGQTVVSQWQALLAPSSLIFLARFVQDGHVGLEGAILK
jgi:hypothetical protein